MCAVQSVINKVWLCYFCYYWQTQFDRIIDPRMSIDFAGSPMRPYGTWRIGAWTASQPPSEWEWEREGERKGPGRWKERGSAAAVDTCRTTKLFRKFLGRVQELVSTSLRFNTAQIDNDITIPPPRPHDRLVDLHNTSWVYSINWVRIERGGMRRRSCGLPSRRDNSCENDHPMLCW